MISRTKDTKKLKKILADLEDIKPKMESENPEDKELTKLIEEQKKEELADDYS